jgi:hypothetical protein
MMQRAASRFLLPLEMVLSLYSVMWGLSGLGWLLRPGVLSRSLELSHHNLAWALVLCVPATIGLATCMLEWSFGKMRVCLAPSYLGARSPWRRLAYWWWCARCYEAGAQNRACRSLSSDTAIRTFVSVRATVAFCAMAGWIGCAVIVVSTELHKAIVMLIPASGVHLVFSWWVYHENMKVRYALDCQISTSSLQFVR